MDMDWGTDTLRREVHDTVITEARTRGEKVSWRDTSRL